MIEPSTAAIEAAAKAINVAVADLSRASRVHAGMETAEIPDNVYAGGFMARAALESGAVELMVAELADRFDAQAKRLLHTCETEFKSSTECVIASIRADTLKKVAAELRGNSDGNH